MRLMSKLHWKLRTNVLQRAPRLLEVSKRLEKLEYHWKSPNPKDSQSVPHMYVYGEKWGNERSCSDNGDIVTSPESISPHTIKAYSSRNGKGCHE